MPSRYLLVLKTLLVLGGILKANRFLLVLRKEYENPF